MSSDRLLSIKMYMALSSLFATTLIVCNLIANKFIFLDLGFKTFVISAGVLPYPITFLITDVLSEIFGEKRTNDVVLTGFGISLFVLFLLWLGNQFPAISNSPVQDKTYQIMFQNSWRVIGASMIAYLAAQLVDVKVFHFWKRLTNGRHLWLRNNMSTIFSQFIDTTLVVLVLFVGVESRETMLNMIRDGWVFKVMVALLDTAPAYLLIFYLKRRFNLKRNDEIRFDA